jgi:hypothetical protein
MASSTVNTLGGVTTIFSSAALVLIFVSYFYFVGFNSMSESLLCSPITIPAYTLWPGAMNRVPNFSLSFNEKA